MENSVLFPNVEVEKDVVLNGVVIDKNVLIKSGTRLSGENDSPVIIEKNQEIGGGF